MTTDPCPVATVFDKRKDRADLLVLVDNPEWSSSQLSLAIKTVVGVQIPIIKITLHRNHKCACYQEDQ